jgi:hypothetical protein
MRIAPPPPVAADAAPAKANPEPIANKLENSVRANGSYPSPTKAHRSISTIAAAILEIEVDHKFADAHLAIWVDDRLTYTHPLEGIDKKHLVVFHKVQGHEFHAVQILPGKHSLRVQVTSDGDLLDRSATIDGEFASGTEKMLHVLVDKNGEMQLSLQ